MMDVVTYSLKNGQPTSDQFYRDVAAFTDRVVARAKVLHPVVERYQAYLTASSLEAVRTRDEYVFELAMLGTLWCEYADDAHSVSGGWTWIMAGLATLRQRGGVVKEVADRARGIMATLFLSPVDREWSPRPTRDHLHKLLNWMAATGDYQQETRRLRQWRDYWATLSPEEVAADINMGRLMEILSIKTTKPMEIVQRSE